MGMGINLNQSSFPADAPLATSIKKEYGIDTNLQQARQVLYKLLDRFYMKLKEHPAQLKSLYLDKMMGLYEMRSFDHGPDILEGKVMGIDGHGRILIEKDDRIKAYDSNTLRMRVI